MPFYAKKSLGQHFLKSKGAIREIVAAAELSPGEMVLEIGPGKGVLTEELLRAGASVVAVEKDDRLMDVLTLKFAPEIAEGRFRLVHEDILTFSPEMHGLTAGRYKLIANIPYYITGEILRQFLENKAQPSLMVLLVQKEVAQRIVAKDEKESILSISVKAYGTPRYIGTVKAKFFSPPPQVDSAIILIKNISKNFFLDLSEAEFFTILKTGFAHKRKIAVSNLAELAPKEFVAKIFDSLSISRDARPEDLTLSDWKAISQRLSTQK